MYGSPRAVEMQRRAYAQAWRRQERRARRYYRVVLPGAIVAVMAALLFLLCLVRAVLL